MSIPDKIHSAALRSSLEAIRHSADVSAKVQAVLTALGKDLVSELTDAGLDTARTDWQRARLRELLKATDRVVSEAYGEVDDLTRKDAMGWLDTSSDRLISRMNQAIGADIVQPINWTQEQLAAIVDGDLVFGASSSEWWKRQDQDLAQAFGDQMRMGALRGEALGDLVQRVKGLMETSTKNAEKLVRSSIISMNNEAHLAAYRANADIMAGVEWVATLDHRACPKCGALDGRVWDLDQKPIRENNLPFPGPVAHWNCRCTQTPVTKTWEELATKNKGLARELDKIPEGQRSSMGGPVSAGMTWEKWFGGLGEADQRDILGAGDFERWQAGKLTLADLVKK